MRRCAACLAALLAGCQAPAQPGDPARGEVLHQSCLQCHGTEVYLPPMRRVRSFDELRKVTLRWGNMYNPGFTPAQIEDLLAYLNRDFYRFPGASPEKR